MMKGKAVLAQPAAPLALRMRPMSRAPGPLRGGGDDAAYWASLRYRGLLQDCQELLKETEAKRRRLHMMKPMKQRLLAEVKFLWKRYKSMSENPSQTIACRVKNRSMPPPAPRAAWAVDVDHRLVHAVGSSSRSLPVQRRQLGPPRAPPVIDLNEACEPSHEGMEMDEFHGYQEPRGINDKRRYPSEADAAAGPSGMRMHMVWDARNPAVRVGKRKISYQDQLLLGV